MKKIDWPAVFVAVSVMLQIYFLIYAVWLGGRMWR